MHEREILQSSPWRELAQHTCIHWACRLSYALKAHTAQHKANKTRHSAPTFCLHKLNSDLPSVFTRFTCDQTNSAKFTARRRDRNQEPKNEWSPARASRRQVYNRHGGTGAGSRHCVGEPERSSHCKKPWLQCSAAQETIGPLPGVSPPKKGSRDSDGPDPPALRVVFTGVQRRAKTQVAPNR